MLAADPPLNRRPAASWGYPIHSLNQSRTVSSNWLGPADSIQEPAKTLRALAMKSPRAPGQVPHDGMKAKYPGWSPRLVNGKTSPLSRSRIRPKLSPVSGAGPASRCSISSRVARRRGGTEPSVKRSTRRSTVWYPSWRMASALSSRGSPPPIVTSPRWARSLA